MSTLNGSHTPRTLVVLSSVLLLFLAACGDDDNTPASINTATPTNTRTKTIPIPPTSTPTPTNPSVPTATSTSTSTVPPLNTPTATRTSTVPPPSTTTATPTVTATPPPTATATLVSTGTATATATSTATQSSTPVELHATLGGENEVPPVTTVASGTATVVVDQAHSLITVTLTTSGLTDVILAHIHLGAVGVPGPVIFPLYSSTDGPFTSPYVKTLSPADLIPGPGAETFDQAVAAILSGGTYANVHTTANQNGEIRGQVGATELHATMTGDNEAPPVTSDATGRASIGITDTAITVTFNTTGLSNVILAHIHIGAVGVAGPVIFPLYGAADGPFTSPYTKTVTAADLVPAPGAQTFAEAVAAIRSGGTYVNIHTTAHSNGEIRGQIGAIELHATMTGDNEVPPVTSDATGRASIGITDTAITVTFSTTGLTNVILAHIHISAVGVPGPVIFPLYSAADGPFTSPYTKTVTAADLIPRPGAQTFAEAVAAIQSGGTYVNIHTTANPNGEIRGQVGATELHATMTGDNEEPPVTTDATGRASIGITDTAITVTFNTTALTNVILAHVHIGAVGVPGPVIFPLYGAADGAFTSPYTKIVTAADLVPAPGAQTFAEAVAAIQSGGTYVNIHTTANQNGEIRGQIGATEVHTDLNGANEAPPVDTEATGRASIGITDSNITVTLRTQGLVDVILAHIHLAPVGVGGPVIFPLYSSADGAFTSPYTKTVTAADLLPGPGAETFAEALAAVRAGGTYINVHTMANQNGEIRGQIPNSGPPPTATPTETPTPP